MIILFDPKYLRSDECGSFVAETVGATAAGVIELNDNGSKGYWASSGNSNDTNGNFAKVRGTSVTVDVAKTALSRPSTNRWMTGHESLHNAGLKAQIGYNKHKVYKMGSEQEVIAFQTLSKSKRFKKTGPHYESSISMKALYLTIPLLVVSTVSHAETCTVQQANSESMKKFRDSSEINI